MQLSQMTLLALLVTLCIELLVQAGCIPSKLLEVIGRQDSQVFRVGALAQEPQHPDTAINIPERTGDDNDDEDELRLRNHNNNDDEDELRLRNHNNNDDDDEMIDIDVSEFAMSKDDRTHDENHNYPDEASMWVH